ncbi:MAG TPA: tetratricopeptide repeat protein [Candidatus Acidoferrum sp.]|nr:tetratricopeptide repeat protein [Candidatus Acidoferrum sp.]
MTPERWQKLKELCHLALEREPGQRGPFLAEACLGDEELRREAESMIARATVGGGVLDKPVWEGLGIEAPAPLVPAAVGRYRIVRVLGEGGMGVVYEAEQDSPRRRVALKVIRPGLASAQMLRRFDRESQALARLHHVGIAQIYEAGSAETSFGPQPFFAMEFIQGEPLSQYADAHRLNTRERLELMGKVCEAVEHAHQQGIIHRDLKPGNILVEESGQPKILDFGVARTTDSDALATRQTDLGQLVGTLSYMSPEQVLGDPSVLDTRSDVYALGVILFELLARRLPYQLSNDIFEATRIIREDDPTRLSSIARTFRGDIDTIVGKALEKEKARRYSSAAALLGDIQKYLADLPISARPASTAYQLQKFARRHKTLVAATAVAFVALAAGIVVSTREAVKARRAEQIAQAVSSFLRNDLLAQAGASAQASPSTKPDPHLEVRTALDRAAAGIGGKFERQPEVEAAIRDTIGQTYLDLGEFPEARTQFERALELRRQGLGIGDPETLKTISHLARLAYLEGRYPESEALYQQALDGERQVLGPEHLDTMASINGLAVTYKEEGKFGQAEELLKSLLDMKRRTLGAYDLSTLEAMHNLALMYHTQGKYAQAEALYGQTLDAKHHALGPEHPSTLRTMHNLAHVYSLLSKYPEAEALTLETLEIRRRVLGAEHPDTLDSAGDLAEVYFMEGKYAQAEELQSDTLKIQRRVLGPENPDTLASVNVLANVFNFENKYPEAEALYKENLRVARRVLGPEHTGTLNYLLDFASVYQRQGKYSSAEDLAAQALAGRRHMLGAEHPRTIFAENALALACLSQGKFADSEALSREALEFSRKLQPDDWEYFRAESLLGASLTGEKRYAEAEPLLHVGYQGILARKDKITFQDREYLGRVREWLLQLYQAWGKPERAAEWRKKSP